MSLAGFKARWGDYRNSEMVGQDPLDVWRKPDVQVGGWCVWYGPDGRDGDCATEVERDGDHLYLVTEYTSVVGYEWYNPKVDKPFLTQSTYVQAPSPRLAARWGVDYMANFGGTEDWVDELP